jgi:hypothetical protein
MAAEQQPDPRVTVAEIEAKAETYKADLRRETDMLKLALEAKFKELSLKEAQATAALASQTTLAKEQMATGGKLQQAQMGLAGSLEGKRMDLKADPAKGSPDPRSMGQLNIAPEEDISVPPPQDVDAALSILGL